MLSVSLRSRFLVACLLAASLLTSNRAMATNFTETFGDLTSTNCDAAWYDQCEVGWEAAGVNQTVEVCDTSSNYGVLVEPSGTTDSGFSKSTAISAGDDELDLTVAFYVLEDNSDIELQLVFKNSSNVTVHTATASDQFDEGRFTMTLFSSIPTTAATVNVKVIGTDSTTTFWVDAVALAGVDKTQDECTDEAEEVRQRKYDTCEEEGGTPTGTCSGTPNANYISGCLITCATICLKNPTLPGFDCALY